MAGHGGARPGAGRPPGGVTQSRRLLVRALQRGLAMAVQDRHPGIRGAEEELALAGAAEIARQMIHAGQGDHVLALLAKVALDQAPREAGEGEGGSLLGAALDRLPGGPSAIGAPVAHLTADDRAEREAGIAFADHRPADQQSAGRLDGVIDGVTLPGQMALGVDAGLGGGLVLDAPPLDASAPAFAGAPARPAPAAPTPTPPRAAARGVIHPHGQNFEILDSREQVRGGLLTRSGAAV